MEIQSKLPNVGTTIFTVMSALATEHGAINLGQGFPDYAMAPELTELVNKAMKDGYNQYAPMPGYKPLLEKIAEKVYQCYGTSIEPLSQITITPGGTYALFSAISSVIHSGDEVIVFEPAYDCYIPIIELNGGIAIKIKLQHPNYGIDWEAVKKVVNPRTRMILINSPHNPTGSVWSGEDILQLRALVEGTNLLIASDEVYEHLIFGGKEHQSILRYPDLLERSFVCFSFGKVYHCTGWKLGYCIAPAAFTKEFRKVHQFNCFSCFTPTQVALSKYLDHSSSYLELGGFLEKKQQYFQQLLSSTPLKPLPTYGSYFQLYSYAGYSNEKEVELAVRLTKEAGVATIPASAFYSDATDHQVLRMCFAKKEQTLEEAAKKLSDYFAK